MQEALSAMRKGGGAMYRHAGGYWTTNRVRNFKTVYFHTSTLEALERRNFIKIARKKEGKYGPFVVEYKLVENGN